MKTVRSLLIFILVCAVSPAYSAIKENISVDKIEVYTEKSKISDLGAGGSSIPAGTKIVVMRSNNSTYAGWRFVSYGSAMNESLSIMLSAKAMNKPVSCVWEDRGNYWVECVGLMIE